jgi:hypothetical protein
MNIQLGFLSETIRAGWCVTRLHSLIQLCCGVVAAWSSSATPPSKAEYDADELQAAMEA